jgi:Kef-type K+ transport system membrane component KefB
MCFLYAWICEEVFGVADITGAFFCGLLIAKDKEKDYVERRSDILGYMLFTPVFFANVGISMNFESIDTSFIWFGLCFILAGVIGKLVGCGLGAKLTGFNFNDSTKIGLGMMVRAEVALICVGKGVDSGLVNPNISTFVIILIVLTSFVTPIFLKLLYKKELQNDVTENVTEEVVQ